MYDQRMPDSKTAERPPSTGGHLKQVNLRLGRDCLRIGKVLSARAGMSLTRFFEMTLEDAMKAHVDKAVEAAIEQSEHYRREAEELRGLISS